MRRTGKSFVCSCYLSDRLLIDSFFCRVKLTPTKDNKHGYINASHVTMAFDGAITQHYIAAQGPLPHTTLDFWQMVWEKSINLIVMVTNFTESGAPKCFTYLPLCNDAGKSVARFGDFEVSTALICRV